MSETYFRIPQSSKKLTVPTVQERHYELIKTYNRSTFDILKQNLQFIQSSNQTTTWEQQVAKAYYDKLFKEYALCSLEQYKRRIGLRWRTKNEVEIGKGQFECGETRCDKVELSTWEVEFVYQEQGIQKECLVKLRLCSKCSSKLHYRRDKDKRKDLKKRKRELDDQRDSNPELLLLSAETTSTTKTTAANSHIDAEFRDLLL